MQATKWKTSRITKTAAPQNHHVGIISPNAVLFEIEFLMFFTSGVRVMHELGIKSFVIHSYVIFLFTV